MSNCANVKLFFGYGEKILINDAGNGKRGTKIVLRED